MPEDHNNKPGIIANFVVRAIVGMAMIFFINEFLHFRGIASGVGLNAVSLLTSGCLGVPGVALLYGIVFYQSL